jgi:hypothetical protein
MGSPWNMYVKKVKDVGGISFKEALMAASKLKKAGVAVENLTKDVIMQHHHAAHSKKHHKGGNKCNMPGDGSGSVTQADAVQCGTAPNACGPAPVAQEGGKRKKRKSRKARKSRKTRKSRKARKSRKVRKSRKRRKGRK